MPYPNKIYINEVCPRDGWQKFKDIIPTDTKIKLIKNMIDSGAKQIEIGTFNSYDLIGSLKDRQYYDINQVVAEIQEYVKDKNVVLTSLVSSPEGVERSLKAGISKMCFFVPVSEVFSERSCKRTISEQMKRLSEVVSIEGTHFTLAAGAVFGSPFGDEVPVERSIDICKEALDMGVKELGLADSAGMSTPANVRNVLSAFSKHFNKDLVTLHLHNTRGMGLANAFAALEEGYYRFDAALGGMGGCPFIKGAKGNIVTEDLVNMAKSMGIEVDYDLDAVIKASYDLSQTIDHPVIGLMAGLYKAMNEVNPLDL